MKQILLFLVSITLLASCATTKPPAETKKETKRTTAPTYRTVAAFNLRYGFYCCDNQEVTTDDDINDIELVFPAIPGRLFGNPSFLVLQTVEVGRERDFRLILPGELNNIAAPVFDDNLTVEPQTTRIIRLGTYHLRPESADGFGGGGFIDSLSQKPLMLVYFSNRAEITGVKSLDGTEYDHQIRVTQPGWHWIEMDRTSISRYTMSVFDGDINNIVFTILLEGYYAT